LHKILKSNLSAAMETVADTDRSWILVSGYWMTVEFTDCVL